MHIIITYTFFNLHSGPKLSIVQWLNIFKKSQEYYYYCLSKAKTTILHSITDMVIICM